MLEYLRYDFKAPDDLRIKELYRLQDECDYWLIPFRRVEKFPDEFSDDTVDKRSYA